MGNPTSPPGPTSPTSPARRRVGRPVATVFLLLATAIWSTPASAAVTEPGASRPAPTALYVEAVFELFVERAPSVSELKTWSAAVHRDDRTALTRTLATSDEWAGARVDALYRTVLRRSADESGRAHWVARIEAGLQLEQVAARFFGGPEYFRRAGVSNGAFVDALYVDILGRKADAGGRAQWVGQLDRGVAGPIGIAASFYASLESRRDRVIATYRDVLDRAPDAGGLQHWTARLSRMGEVDLAASLAASDELYQRSGGFPAPNVRTAPVGPGTAYPLTASWRPGCPVHHRDLVAVEFPHLRDDGSIAPGTLVVHRSVSGQVAVAVRALYGSGFPLTSARPVDDFDGSDDRSMEADNSSAFNCRPVAGSSSWSEHAYGRAIDLNPRRNPYVRGSSVDPPSGSTWTNRRDVRPGMVVDPGPVVEVFDQLGWGWGGRWTSAQDYQHFSTSGR